MLSFAASWSITLWLAESAVEVGGLTKSPVAGPPIAPIPPIMSPMLRHSSSEMTL